MKNNYEDLNNLQLSGDPREIKRALAVRMNLIGFTRSDVAKACNVSIQFVDKWKAIYLTSGVEGLKLAHKGSKGYLLASERQEIIAWIKTHKVMTVKKLKSHVEKKYNVFYQSNTSYIQLLEQADLSYKRIQK